MIHARRLAAVLTLVALGVAPTLPAAATAAPKDDPRMAWFREARFGMFIHWGLYAIPAGEWGKETGHGEWIRETAQIPVEEYEKFLPKFDPVKFDANAWAALANEAGMSYVVITSKHHDGFALFDSKLTDWDVMSTPFRRDIMTEMSTAVRKQGMTMCFYHSIMDWHHPDYLPRRSWETEEMRSPKGADFDRYAKFLHGQVEELLTNYGPIGIMWFDGEWESTWNHEYGQALYDHCRRLQPNVIVNNRVDKGRAGMAGMTVDDMYAGDYGTPEQEIPARGLPGVAWETCMTMNEHWGYNSRDLNWKSSRQLIRMLVDIASKGGNFLLNVGPTAEGLIPDASVERLKAMGRWMKVNGEAIHGSQASPFESTPFGRVTQKRDGANTHLYLCVFDWPQDGKLVINGLGNEVVRARLLARPDAELKLERRGTGCVVDIGAESPDADCAVVDLVVAGAPIVYEPPRFAAPTDRFVNALDVSITTASADLAIRYTTDGSAPTAKSASATAPIRLVATTTLRAQAFHGDKAVSEVVERRFEKVAPLPALAVVDGGTAPGLSATVFHGRYSRCDDFAKAEGVEHYDLTAIDLSRHQGQESFGLRLEGFLQVDRDEVYWMILTSDDGSRLTIDGVMVVDLDGLHNTESREGTIALAAGRHAIRIEYFNGTGGADLDLRIAPLGEEPQAAAGDRLLHSTR